MVTCVCPISAPEASDVRRSPPSVLVVAARMRTRNPPRKTSTFPT